MKQIILKGGKSMELKKITKKLIVSTTNKMLKHNANSTSCLYIYQPKVPKQLSRFSRIKNDK